MLVVMFLVKSRREASCYGNFVCLDLVHCVGI